ncbi:MAG: YceI family protein [Actinomycetota bacterium]
MSTSYTYDPDAWHPMLAGAVAGAIAAIVAGLASVALRSPDEVIANSLTVVLTSIALGLLAGALWRRLRATDNAEKVFAWSMVGAFFAVAAAIALADLFVLSNVITYAGPLAVIIFITLGFFVPMLSRVTAAVWIAAIPIIIALALGVGLFGRGNVASGELSLDDLDTPSSQTTEPAATGVTSTAAVTGSVAIPEGLAASYVVASGTATYSVEETLNGLSAQGVGSTETVSGSVAPENAFTFDIDLLSFTSDQGRRDNKVREWFADFPVGTFSSDTFDLPESASVGEVITMTIPGTMSVNDIEQAAEWVVEARLESNGEISLQGETDIVLSDFDIPVVAVPFVTMTDGARIEVLLTLTPDA